jgi:peroxin-7
MPSLAFHPGFVGNSIRTNPWRPHEVVVCAADNFGISGTGKVYLVSAGLPDASGPAPPGMDPVFTPLNGFGTADGAFDACFSEIAPNILVVAQGDGVKVYDVNAINPVGITMPVAAPMGHTAEVVSVDWSPHKQDCFISSSWDATVKVWAGNRLDAGPIQGLVGHLKEVYEAQFHPRTPTLVASASGDGTWRLWDLRVQKPGGIVTIPGHGADLVMSLDWNRYEPNMLATGSVDRTVKLWDIRKPQQAMLVLRGHDHAVRRVRFSPHSRSQLLSCGYDYRVVTWDLQHRPQFMTHRYEHHREFVVGCDWSMATPGAILSAGWDGMAFAWTVGRPPSLTPPQQLAPLPLCQPPPRPPGASRLIRR